MKTQSKIGCGNLIKTTALLLGFFAVFGGIIFVIVSIFGYIENGWVPGVICMLSGWVGGLILFGFGIIVDAHEDEAASENACAESAASASPVHPVFKAEDTEKVVPNIAPKNHLGNASNSAPKKTKEGWACPRCSTVNPNYIGSCQNCGDPKPSGTGAPASSSQTSATVSKVGNAPNSAPKKAKEGWACPRCSTVNPIHIGSCHNCGDPKPSGSTVSAGSSQAPATVNKVGNASSSSSKKTKEGWGCPRCSTINPNFIGSCQNCGDPKPSGSTAPASSSQDPATVGWHCSRCGTENSKYVGNCIKCGTAKPQA